MNSTDLSTPDDSLRIEAIPLVFFPVSMVKLAVLSFCTLGLYNLYWFYKNWKVIKIRDREDISPFWRSFFSLLFCYWLFARMDREFKRHPGPDLSVGWLAAGWIALILTANLPDPYWLLSMFSFLFMLPIQGAVNRMNLIEAPGLDRNSRFGAWNITTVIVGGLFALLAIVATFLPAEPI